MLQPLIQIQYCYDYLLNQIPMGLLIYAHIPTALIALLFGGFLVYRSRSLPNVTLFIVCVSFALWCIFDLATWFAFLGAGNTMFTWSLLDFFALIFFFFSYYFLYSFITKRDLPVWQKIASVAVLLPTALWTLFGSNLTGFEANYCEALENESIALYPYFVEGLFILAVIALVVYHYRKATEKDDRKTIALAGTGVFLFLFFFFSATLLVNLLVESNASAYAYNFEIYGLFGMPILLVYLGRLILKYKAFNVKVFAAQMLVASVIILVGSQFAFLISTTNLILNAVTFVLVSIFGVYLIKNVKKEINQREQIETLAHDLEKTNEKLESLDKLKTEFLSLASHQLRSPLTAIKGYASMLDEGTYGALEDKQQEAVQRIYSSAQGLVSIVEDLLNVSKIEQGGMKYEFMPTELAPIVTALYNEMKIPAGIKGLEFLLDIPNYDKFMANVDPLKIKQVFLNLVDNSIKYTPGGFVKLSLSRKDDKILFSVADNGVGITPETKAKLFEKFSRGEGGKLNTGGSGLGLYLAQEIAKAHKGRIVIESEGQGKGSTFIVELPAAGAHSTSNDVIPS